MKRLWCAARVLSLLVPAAALATDQTSMENGMPPGGMPMSAADCERMAGIPGAPMSVETCKSMMGMAGAYQQSAADPAASRPGDEAMSCAQISSEMSQLKGVGVSESTAREGQQASQEMIGTLNKQRAEAERLGIEATVATNAAAVKDPTGRLAEKVQQTYAERGQELGRKQAAERQPAVSRQDRAVGASAAQMTQSVQGNPRFARLIQLAGNKGCKGDERAGGRAEH
jgi:hypothetical protein